MEDNYKDELYEDIKQQETSDLEENSKTFDNMINRAEDYYDAQINAVGKWGEEQTKLQKEQSDFTINQIEQQKQQVEKDYTKEQKGAYTDWQKQTNQYGANAEQMASQGMVSTGYSESSKVSMYNQYQNRVAIARETYNKAVLEYDNAIKEAQLQNNSVLAEIAFNTLQQKLTLSLEGFQYKNSLLLEKSKQNTAIKDRYYNRWQDVLDQINYENDVKYQRERDVVNDQRYVEQLQYQKDRDAISDDQWNKEYELAQERQKDEHGTEPFTNTPYTDKAYIEANTPGYNGKWTTDTAYVTDTHVTTPYYQGEKNKDGDTYGYFKNEYQPMGIENYGKVHKTYDDNKEKNTVTFSVSTRNGQVVTVTQNLWETDDGTQWVWLGVENKYVTLEELQKRLSITKVSSDGVSRETNESDIVMIGGPLPSYNGRVTPTTLL